ncbi:MAG: hydrolase [Candidatus Obscuribacterales bacterium]|nr:hydrolase [Candidatus Obscuribacterales bacterium]
MSTFMRHPDLLTAENSLLLIIDVQEKFREHIHNFQETMHNIVVMAKGAKLLDVPVFVTEQYPHGLGKTVKEIAEVVELAQEFEKTAFSCCQDSNFNEALKKASKQQIVVCGIEAHVCVSQTVLDLLHMGYRVHVVVDAVSSRSLENKNRGLQKMQTAGALMTTVEMSLLELVGDSAKPVFKGVQRLIK